VERETGIEPATNSLEGCDSTTELLPRLTCSSALRFFFHLKLPINSGRASHSSNAAATRAARLAAKHGGEVYLPPPFLQARASFQRAGSREESWWGGEGSNLRRHKAGRFTVCCD
jgi:hypothetical protein